MSAHDVMEWNGWHVGVINLRCSFIGKVVDTPVAGWTKGFFGLDFRALADPDDDEGYVSGWVLTHLPTGFIVRVLHVGHAEALKLADEIADFGDWDFTEPARCRAFVDPIQGIMKAHPGKVLAMTGAIGPRP